MAYCIIDNMPYYYVEAGEGSPLVLLHPAPLDHTLWFNQLLHLSRDFRVLALDQRCFGRSAKPESPFPISVYGSDLERFLDALGLASANIIGISLGGMAAQMLALRNPARIRRMVLVNTTAITTATRAIRERLEGFQSQGIGGFYRFVVESLFSPAFRQTELGWYLVDEYVRSAVHLSPASLLRFYEALQSFDILGQIARINTPTLVVAGTEDFTFELSRKVAAGIPGATLVTVEGCGRSVPVEAPAYFNNLARDFLCS